MTNVLVERGYLTQSLGSASHSGEHGLKTVPGLLKLVLEKQAWRERIIVQTGEEFEGFTSFEAYVKATPPKGLGTDITTLKRLVADNRELRDLIDAEMEKAHPRGNPTGANQHTEIGKCMNHALSSEGKGKQDRSDQLLRRLRKDYPDLHKQVLRSEITVTEAAIRAKIYPPRIAVNLRDPKSAANTLLTHASPEFLDELRKILIEGIDST